MRMISYLFSRVDTRFRRLRGHTLSTPLRVETTDPDERMSRTEATFNAKDMRPLANRMGHPRLGSA